MFSLLLVTKQNLNFPFHIIMEIYEPKYSLIFLYYHLWRFILVEEWLKSGYNVGIEMYWIKMSRVYRNDVSTLVYECLYVKLLEENNTKKKKKKRKNKSTWAWAGNEWRPPVSVNPKYQLRFRSQALSCTP